MWRNPTLRSLVEVLDRVIGKGVIVESDVPVSPAVDGLRRAAEGRREERGGPESPREPGPIALPPPSSN